MNIKEVKDLIHEILQSDISEFELEHTGTKVKLRRGLPPEITSSAPATVAASPSTPAPAPRTVQPIQSAAAEESDESGLHFITSPIVGTLYRSPTPGAEPFTKVGDIVEEGTVLCIVEAMKLMNEIPSDIAGEVVRILVENAHPVEFGQRLFAIRPRH